jgi:ribonuclease VapC
VAETVIDASALLALLHAESGADIVAKALPGAVISALNLSEVIAKLDESGMPQKEIRSALSMLGLVVVPFDEELAYRAGVLRTPTKSAGLSLGDRGCLSLAQKLGFPALTADRSWLELSIGVTIRAIR